MDERKSIIRELEKNNKADADARNQLLADLGEVLLKKVTDDESFPEKTGKTPGAVLAEYRKKQQEISDSEEHIKSLETDIALLKDLEQKIAVAQDEQSATEKELVEDYVRLGKLLLDDPGLEETTATYKQQEEIILARIDEQEKKLTELDGQDGGVLAWFGKNAQMTLSKTLLLKNRSALQRLYRSTGEYLVSTVAEKILNGETAGYRDKILEKRELLASIVKNLQAIKSERRQIVIRSGAEGSPLRNIQILEKLIKRIHAELNGIYLRFGLLAAESTDGDTLFSLLSKSDNGVLEKAKNIRQEIARRELEIEKIKAAISIDNEKNEMEKINRAILGQKQRISDAEDAIANLEKQLAESEQHIVELETFIRDNRGITEDHGSENSKN